MIAADTKIVTDFAKQQGFVDGEINTIPTGVTDLWANRYGENQVRTPQRFVLTGTVELRSGDVARVRDASQKAGDLIAKGVALSFPEYSDQTNPSYLFTRLNDVRPTMLRDATKSARAVAEQFAADSGSKLGTIRQANQGVFQVLSADSSGEAQQDYTEQRSIEKKIRLVSTIQYYLVN